jgi:hypothetical protein
VPQVPREGDQKRKPALLLVVSKQRGSAPSPACDGAGRGRQSAPEDGDGCQGLQAVLQCWSVVVVEEAAGLQYRGRAAQRAPRAGSSYMCRSELGRVEGRLWLRVGTGRDGLRSAAEWTGRPSLGDWGRVGLQGELKVRH